MTKFLCFVVVTAFTIAVISAIDCNNNMCTAQGKQHTLCLYPNSKPAAACGKVISVGLTDTEKNRTIGYHNWYRFLVTYGLEKRGNPGPQPPAANMLILNWDDELADIAQRWANQCNFGHDSCRSVSRFYVGQNAVMKSTTTTVTKQQPEIIDMIQMWYDEVKDMDRNQVTRYTGTGKASHYTQLVWANTYTFGCGKIVYQINEWEHNYVVCNYGPGGNVINEPVYLINTNTNHTGV